MNKKISELYSIGHSTRSIRTILGISHKKIMKTLECENIKMRTSGSTGHTPCPIKTEEIALREYPILKAPRPPAPSAAELSRLKAARGCLAGDALNRMDRTIAALQNRAPFNVMMSAQL